MEVAVPIDYDDFSMKKVIRQNIKNYVNVFEASCLIKTHLWVSHNNFCSIYNILTQSWEHHIQFASRVELIRKEQGFENYTLAILLRDSGKLYTNVMDVLKGDGGAKSLYDLSQEEPEI